MVAIAILDDYQNVALKMADWSRLKDLHRIQVFDKPFASEAEAARALVGFDCLGIMRERTPMSRSLLANLPNLRLIVTTGMRNAAIDLAAAAEQKITVCGTESGQSATAELAFGLILSLARSIPYEAIAMRQGAWQTTLGLELRGRTLGLLGLGKLGSQVARFGQAFGMPVIAWSENLTDEKAKAAGVERVTKDELFRRTDVLSIHTVLSPRTRGIVGVRELGLMKPSALLVNTSRGPIIDTDALLATLKAGKILGAALDVYDVEPLPANHPLRSEPRALLVPHIGYVTEETYRLFYGGMVEALEGWLAGKPVRVLKA
ncbi:MAG TPA: D-2-hydroxyacid dehydrogenase family protein [Hyphomicrobiaceae bacterium]|nr:D-2-hydroxyacid dehydrogenase family protein [Hyphomicrobiaceae bacterium]